MATFQIGDVYDLSFPANHFDVVMCNNVLYHLPSIVQPISELLRVTRRIVVIRTLIGERSFYIKEVLSNLRDPNSQVPPESEFDDHGEPVSFSYLNIYSRAYFESVIRNIESGATINIMEDTFFEPAAIEEDWGIRKFPNATRILAGNQVNGHVMLPFHFVVIAK